MQVALRPVTAENWQELIKLKVGESQKHFVASNLYSIAESMFGFEDEGHWDLRPFGVYDSDVPVGFVMYALNLNHSRFQSFVMRLMVDEEFQGKGYGREAMRQVLDTLRAMDKIGSIGISYEPENHAARKLYAGMGFMEPGEMIEGETLAVLKIR